ncbi:putative LPS assembly protein LptD [Mesohalobacter halotolerans]|uniref:LPS-assembly protein LptD n=1 Tax=Mesohalobacter halotolerans TaxID=1883405 RepID=A0A4U5TRX3_9FLAO|nr:putative LPS assembly protein LptD [Mesohalobacter halotolerans]MBS3737648.1 LPS-assembly protein LptD [Psychroflexus sp.]TKS56581.1 LPS-assembly protein LptD [Mesohalobacter halotolerans]
MQARIPHILLCICFSVSFNIHAQIDQNPLPSTPDSLQKKDIIQNDNLKIESKGIITVPRNPIVNDSVRTDTVNNAALTDIVKKEASGYQRMSKVENKMYLYDEAKIQYGDIELTAGRIILNNNNDNVFAAGIKDSTGYTQRPVFKQGSNVVEPDSIFFNYKTKKALIYNSRTQDGELNIIAEASKRVNDSVYYMRNAKFTTSEDVDNPEYYFLARKIKFVPDSKVVTGLVNMYIADVPTPLGLPYGFFPLADKQSSGFIIPSFGDNRNRGFFLQNGGYYFAISDYVDLKVLGDIYTNGSYGLRFDSNYAFRYKFNGRVSLRYEKLFIEERGFPNFSEQQIFNFRWNHNQDQKANPSSRFSASVNLGSSQFFRQSVNQTNTGNFLNNSFNSSISYSKTFEGEPGMNLNISATHSQNTNTEQINMTLPTLQFSINRIYPFEPKFRAKKGAIENINLQYNLRGENRIQTTDSLFLKPQMFDDLNAGIQHSIPITTNFKVFDHFSVSTNLNYQETWVFETFEPFFDEESQTIARDTISGFDSYRTYNVSASVGTTVYGMFNFGDDKKIKAIRHVMRPTVSYSINPGFDQYFEEINIPGVGTTPDRTRQVSRFDGTLFGAPNPNFASSMSFGLTNDFEAKVRKKDTTLTGDEAYKKVKLLSNLGLNASYNFAADSLKLSPISLRGNIPLFDEKVNINIIGALDMYALDSNNRRINTLNINNGGSLFRLTRANVSFGYRLSNEDFTKEEEDEDEEQDEEEDLNNDTFLSGGRPDDLFGSGDPLNDRLNPNGKKDKPKTDDNEFYNYKPPWSLNLQYAMTYNNSARQNEISSHSIMFSGDIELSPRWSIGGSSGFDLVDPGFTFTQLRFSRDLKSWQMSFNWRPIGNQRSWFFFIGIKSGIFRDIKYDKNREPDRRLN